MNYIDGINDEKYLFRLDPLQSLTICVRAFQFFNFSILQSFNLYFHIVRGQEKVTCIFHFSLFTLSVAKSVCAHIIFPRKKCAKNLHETIKLRKFANSSNTTQQDIAMF